MPVTKGIQQLSNKATNMLNPSNFGYLESMQIVMEKFLKQVELDVELDEESKNVIIEFYTTRLTEFKAAHCVLAETLSSIARYKFNPPVQPRT